jgi:hypothetical protein
MSSLNVHLAPTPRLLCVANPTKPACWLPFVPSSGTCSSACPRPSTWTRIVAPRPAASTLIKTECCTSGLRARNVLGWPKTFKLAHTFL